MTAELEQKTTDINKIGKLLVQSIEADFKRNGDRFLSVMQALGDAHGGEIIRPYMKRYEALKRKYEIK